MAEPLIVIVGETASGKSALGMELARRFNGEIIAADSRTVYCGMDIGTAKPSVQDQIEIRHHLLDIVDPDQPFTAADFKRLANQAIEEIHGRGKLPIMVGGTGLYVDALLYDYQFRPPADPTERRRLQLLTITELQAELAAKGIPLPDNATNPRHLTRVLETAGAPAVKSVMRLDTLLLGLKPDREVLHQRIADRVEVMFNSGLVVEATSLFAQYGPDVPGLETPGYTALREYLEGHIDIAETKLQFIRNDRYLAKRQRTWFKRNNSIQWLPQQGTTEKSVELTTTFLHTL